ncbi:tyrosine-type recombinase/integrase [Bacillus sp. A1]|uniref:tyrosine-type recombinase/integrase n=1 Tax=Bacillus sp. A1 TaxID=228104 RepID=UPI002EB8146A|nr:tyrosine-type recombinase/integrase [Bacillus subtilis]MED3696205.1 tyrosine-type recombinase/integrase [Bacillus subtilis]
MPKISNVYQDKNNGKWYFVASLGYDEKGKRVQHWERGFSTQREAKRAYDEYMNNYSRTSIKKNSTMAFKEFYETYFKPDYKLSVSDRTFENRVSSMDYHFSFFFNKKLKDISPPMIKKWQNNLSEKYSSSYIRNIHGLLQKSLDLAKTLGLIQKNSAKTVGNVKKIKKKVDFWTKDEFEKFISTFNTDDYYEHFAFMTIWLLFMTGLRFGEAQALEWDSDIDLNEKTLSVSKSMYYKNTKKFYITEPKTKASNRLIALDDDTIEFLIKWKKRQLDVFPSKYVLSYNGLPTNKSSTFHIIEQHSNLANVHKIKTHALRHSHASLLISLGENALVIRDRLGHEDIQTTLGTYGHLYPNMNREVAKRLSNTIHVKFNGRLDRKRASNQYLKRNSKES